MDISSLRMVRVLTLAAKVILRSNPLAILTTRWRKP